jgi:Heme/copper-type cytochrome/quinol oxidase, subunit 3
MTAEEMIERKTLDVAHLPTVVFDYRSPLWWGNLWGLTIETVVFGILVAVYFTAKMDLSPFPPPQADRPPFLHNTYPDLFLPTVTLIVLLVSVIPAVWLDISARRMDERAVKILVIVTLIFNFALIVLRAFEFKALHFRWDDNAYGSITWTILGMHLIHFIVLAAEDVYLVAWTYSSGLDKKHALDISVTAVYWYWIAGVWIALYTLIYFGPRIM